MNKYQEALDWCIHEKLIDDDVIAVFQELIDIYNKLLKERDRLAFELCEARNNDTSEMYKMMAKGTTVYYGK